MSKLKEKLSEAKKNKNDEFYTQLVDIERELHHYKNHFKDKVVFCNCDDPEESNFWKYFELNFEHFGLKKLIATHFEFDKPSYKIELNSYRGTPIKTKLEQNGDFRSPECIEILKESDVVVTNPPFSLFREYIAQLVEYDKKFIIIGHQNAISYKDVFKLIKENKVWLGSSILGGNTEFRIPKNQETSTIFLRTDKDGNKLVKMDGIRWFTNLDYPKRHEDIFLFKEYTPEEYPAYVNYDAINVDKTVMMPNNYFKEIGVPISFISKYNPDQFEIIGLGIVGSLEFKNNIKMEILDKAGKPTGKFTNNAKGTLYRLHNPEKDKKPSFLNRDTGELYQSIYARIIIKRK